MSTNESSEMINYEACAHLADDIKGGKFDLFFRQSYMNCYQIKNSKDVWPDDKSKRGKLKIHRFLFCIKESKSYDGMMRYLKLFGLRGSLWNRKIIYLRSFLIELWFMFKVGEVVFISRRCPHVRVCVQWKILLL